MRRLLPALVLYLFVAAAAPLPSQEVKQYIVVVNPAVPVDFLSKTGIADLFLKKTKQWRDGTDVLPVDLTSDSTVRAAFSEDILGRQVSAVKSYWQRQIFSGRAVPPPERPNDEEVLAFIRSNPGAIGYVSPTTPVGNLRILRVTE